VWLRVGDEIRRETAWPVDAGTDTEHLVVEGEELPAFSDGLRPFAVRHQGELLGALAIDMPPSEPLTPTQSKLVEDLASQAGLVLRNVRLIEELRASRERLVRAQDEERRRLERNIHDGAQQQMVAMAVKVNLAESLAARQPGGDVKLLAELKQDLQDALENLRDLARGIYPPLLADQGLAAALSAQGRKSVVPVAVSIDGIERYPQDIEAAVYFCCLEALQNVAKYAGASGVTVSLAESLGELTFEVQDDGVGFDATRTKLGSGLQNMTDRLAALGGSVQVRSRPGEGTTVAGRIPIGENGSVLRQP
jgi:signal transduction histidine kinase